eukprot:4880234-Amphidinium_carterae.1
MFRMMVDTVLPELPLKFRNGLMCYSYAVPRSPVTREAALTPLTLGTEASPQGAMAHRTHSAAWIWR